MLTALAALRGDSARAALGFTPKSVALVGLDGAGHWAAVARAVAPRAWDRAAIDTQGFRFAKIGDWLSEDLLPGGAKYFDLPGFLALGAPGPLFLAGEPQNLPRVLSGAYAATPEALRVAASGDAGAPGPAAVRWLLSP